MKRFFGIWFSLISLVAGCGKPPPPAPPLERLYAELAERREDFRVEALRGRTILIDPGHGGRFTGTTGREGLEEKDVNLGVALYLWGLLRDAGADAHLTRTSDRDFLDGADSLDLAKDLAARLAITDSRKPDLFVSIHHNAAADTNRSRNRIETYFPIGHEGPSLDAARAIHAHLMRNLGITEGSVRPGNYYVLRKNRFPAVLGEPSYLSHPPVEEKLVLGEKRRLEAEAYFLGIVEYFQRGVPVAEIESPGDTVSTVDGLRLAGTVVDVGGEGIDPGTVEATLDGKAIPVLFDPATGKATAPLPYDLVQGTHEVALRGRNLGGNACRGGIHPFRVLFPPVEAEASAMVIPEPGLAIIRLRLTDERGLPVADGTPVRFEIPGVKGTGPDTKVASGFTFVHVGTESIPDTIRVASLGRTIAVPLPPEKVERPPAVARILFSDTADTSAAPKGARLLRDDGWVGTPGPGGWIAMDRPPAPADRYFGVAPGYISRFRRGEECEEAGVVMDLLPVSLSPLRGKRILIDPAEGAGDAVVPPSARSLRLARDLEEMLAFLGGNASLTRTGEETPDIGDRILVANRAAPDYWITIEYGDRFEVRHFPGSKEGTPLAEAVAEAIGAYRNAEVAVRDGAERALRDTPCPAIVVTLPLDEERGRPTRAEERAVAEGIAGALAERLDQEPTARATLQIDLPFPYAQVRIDDAVTYQDRGAAVWRVSHIPAGDHLIQIETPAGWREHLLLLPAARTTVLLNE